MLAVAYVTTAGYGVLVHPTAGARLSRLARRVMWPLAVRAVVSRPMRQRGPQRGETGREQEQERDEPED
jgi:hypothetical protein